MPGKIAAAVTVAAVGVLCALAAVTLWLGPVGQRDALLQAAAAADGAVSGRMEALGRELEREGAKVAGANLIKEARELAGGRTSTGRFAAKTHLLQQKQQGAYPAVPAMNVGFSGSAPFKLGKNGNKIYEAPHVGGTNGVYMGANGGGNGWARKAPRKHTHKKNQQALSAVVPPFAQADVYPAAVPPRTRGMRGRAMRGMRRRLAPPKFGRQRRPAFGGFNHREAPHIGNPRLHALVGDYNGFARRSAHALEPSSSPGDEWGPSAPYPDNGDWDNDWEWEDENAAQPEEGAAEPAEEWPQDAAHVEGAEPDEGRWVWVGDWDNGDWVWEEPGQKENGAEPEPEAAEPAEEAAEPAEEATEPEETAASAEPEAAASPRKHGVASGYPATYDGAWGDQYYRNAGGNEEAMKKAGVNYDDYPLDVYRTIPFFHFDPSATKGMEQNQKIRAGKKLDVPRTQQFGANKGGQTMGAAWGTWIQGGEAEDNIRKGGLKIDHDPLHFRSGFPNPAWDKSEYDQARHVPVKPAKDAWEVVHSHRKSQVALESKGVSVNGFPIDKPDAHREYNQVDGLMDTLVKTEDTPKYRDSGIARQEHPLHFLLDEDVNGKPTSQADGINKLFASGKLDKQRQNIEDRSQGVELNAAAPVSWDKRAAEEPEASATPVGEEEKSKEEPAEEPAEEPSEDYSAEAAPGGEEEPGDEFSDGYEQEGHWVWVGDEETGDWVWEEPGQSAEQEPESTGQEADSEEPVQSAEQGPESAGQEPKPQDEWQNVNGWNGEPQWQGVNSQWGQGYDASVWN